MALAPLAQFSPMLSQLAEATAELRTARAVVVSQREDARGYTVEVEVEGERAAIATDARAAALSNFRVVALMPERVDGARSPAPKVETALAGELAAKGFRVIDWNFVAGEKPLTRLVQSVLADGRDAAAELGSRFLANLIIVGRADARFSQQTARIISYGATAQLRAIKADTGQVLLATELREKGFGQDREQAAREALDALASAVARRVPAELLAHVEEYPVTVQVALEKPEDSGTVETLLRGLTGVTSLQRIDTQSGPAYRIRTREKPALLGQAIERGGVFRVVEFGRRSE